MEIRFQSDVGRRRSKNQDYANVFENQAKIPLAVLADGMGGHLAGEVASQMVVTELGDTWQATAIQEPEEAAQWMIDHLQAVNQRIYEAGQEDAAYDGMGSTAVVVALMAGKYVIANVGDSRAYLLRDQSIVQITEDHSLVNELVKSGEITKEMAEHHPRKNILIRTVGMPGQIAVDVFTDSWQAGDYLLLCSDGLTNMVSEAEIVAIVSEAGLLEEKVTTLIERANEAGGLDNITVLVIQCEEGQQ